MTEIVDYKIFSLYIVFGFIILIGYLKMTFEYWPKGLSAKIWTNEGRNKITNGMIKYAYLFMICLSFVAGPYLIYYLSTTPKNETDEILIYIGSVLFLVCSAIWAFFPFKYNKIILGTVAMGAILILAGIATNNKDPKEPKKAVALTASSIIVTQTFFFDFLLWTGLLTNLLNKLS